MIVRAGPVEGRQEHERIIVVQGCRGLAKANMMGLGSSDPFVTITINGVEVARTYTIPATLTPMWDRQMFFIPCPLQPTKANPLFNGTARGCSLEIEVWDEKDNGAKVLLTHSPTHSLTHSFPAVHLSTHAHGVHVIYMQYAGARAGDLPRRPLLRP